MSTTSSLKSKTSYVFVGDILTPVVLENAPEQPENISVDSRSSLSLIDSNEKSQQEGPILRPTGVKVIFSTYISNRSGS